MARSSASGPQFVSEPKTDWGQLAAPAAIFAGLVFVIFALAGELRDWAFSWMQPALNWSREQNNAGVIQAGAAILQAVGAVILLVLTWHSTKTTRELAERSQRQAAAADGRAWHAEMRANAAAERQAVIATMPVIIFRAISAESTLFGKLTLKLSNVGQGPALFTKVEMHDSAIDYLLNRAGEAITLSVGEEVELELVADDDEELRFLLADPKPDKRGRIPLVTLSAECLDVRGGSWVSEAWLVWERERGEVRIGNAYFPYPA